MMSEWVYVPRPPTFEWRQFEPLRGERLRAEIQWRWTAKPELINDTIWGRAMAARDATPRAQETP